MIFCCAEKYSLVIHDERESCRSGRCPSVTTKLLHYRSLSFSSFVMNFTSRLPNCFSTWLFCKLNRFFSFIHEKFIGERGGFEFLIISMVFLEYALFEVLWSNSGKVANCDLSFRILFTQKCARFARSS